MAAVRTMAPMAAVRTVAPVASMAAVAPVRAMASVAPVRAMLREEDIARLTSDRGELVCLLTGFLDDLVFRRREHAPRTAPEGRKLSGPVVSLCHHVPPSNLTKQRSPE